MKPCVGDLLIHVDPPSEVLLETVQLLANVFFNHGKERDFKVLQLGLQRGQLSSLLMTDRETSIRPQMTVPTNTHPHIITHLSAQ